MNLTENIKEFIQDSYEYTKSNLLHVFHQREITFQEIAEFILHHPNASVTSRDLLGSYYHRLHLEVEHYALSVLSRSKEAGNVYEKIMSVSLNSPKGRVCQYESFTKKQQLTDQCIIPEDLM